MGFLTRTPMTLDEVIARQDATPTLPEELAVWAARRSALA